MATETNQAEVIGLKPLKRFWRWREWLLLLRLKTDMYISRWKKDLFSEGLWLLPSSENGNLRLSINIILHMEATIVIMKQWWPVKSLCLFLFKKKKDVIKSKSKVTTFCSTSSPPRFKQSRDKADIWPLGPKETCSQCHQCQKLLLRIDKVVVVWGVSHLKVRTNISTTFLMLLHLIHLVWTLF